MWEGLVEGPGAKCCATVPGTVSGGGRAEPEPRQQQLEVYLTHQRKSHHAGTPG